MPDKDVLNYVRAFREYESGTKHAESVITEALRDSERQIASLNVFTELLRNWKGGAVSGYLKPDSLEVLTLPGASRVVDALDVLTEAKGALARLWKAMPAAERSGLAPPPPEVAST